MPKFLIVGLDSEIYSHDSARSFKKRTILQNRNVCIKLGKYLFFVMRYVSGQSPLFQLSFYADSHN